MAAILAQRQDQKSHRADINRQCVLSVVFPLDHLTDHGQIKFQSNLCASIIVSLLLQKVSPGVPINVDHECNYDCKQLDSDNEEHERGPNQPILQLFAA